MKSLLLIAVSVLLVFSVIMVLTPAVAAPPSNIPPADKDKVPPGLTRVTVIHEIDRTRTIVDHGPGIVPPPRQQTSFACTDAGEDTCDTNSFNGKKWFNLPVNYFVNLEDSNDDGNFLAAVKAGSQVWEDGANSSFDQEFISETDLQASGAQQRQMDGFNVVDWGNTKKFGFSVIAVTVFWYFTSTGEIVEADFRYNQDFSWSSNFVPNDTRDPADNFGDSASMDVQNIGAHEFGHFHAALFDITDSSASALTMYAFGSLGETQKRDLGVGDQLSIETAYPPTITPPPPNNPPTANDDSKVTDEDIAVVIDVLFNDSNGDGTIDPTTVTVTSGPTNGQTSVDGTSGDITYTPDPDYNGDDSFTYTVKDDLGATSNEALVTISVNPINDAPVANDDSATTTIDTAVTIDVLSNDYDVDGDPLSYSNTFPITTTNGGTVTLNADNTLEYSPLTLFVSPPDDTFLYTITDGLASDSATVTVTVNEPTTELTVTSITPDSGPKGSTGTYTVTGTGFIDGLTVSMEGGSGPTPSVSVTGVSFDGKTIDVQISIKSGGPKNGSIWDVRVTNPDGTSFVKVEGFTVTR